MKKQFYYDSLEEKEKIINESNNLYVIELSETLKGKYIILSDNPIYEKLSYEELENELLTNELKGEIL
ncbi:TPA: hypothetical protein ACHTFF_002213 [Clostridioides difficile]|uniref:Uncharacterized protein n=2 Tax=Clostridioides difficile TaxID=1496 RepID=A0A069B2S7_CLODI|nr:hypothetical protein [Clostridioides difficile]AXU79096.1 hypothetical protein CDIF29688_01743 [Clostridioides difficile]EGT3762158.1 hypothetical protein [Clostridioides difficile]EGT3769303.1 hypothetical protein [Clostridioides difficile]EGT4113235.1 hypothetical protein [Clostridioides difficile]EGT4518650.1 hypothetical protein [Clostridioides difficile]